MAGWLARLRSPSSLSRTSSVCSGLVQLAWCWLLWVEKEEVLPGTRRPMCDKGKGKRSHTMHSAGAAS